MMLRSRYKGQDDESLMDPHSADLDNPSKTTNHGSRIADKHNSHKQPSSIQKALRAENRNVIVCLAVILTWTIISTYQREPQRSAAWWFLLTILSLPLWGVASVILTSKKPHQRWTALGVLGVVVGNHLPQFLSLGLVMGGLTVFGLASRPTPGNHQANQEGRTKAVLAALIMILVFLVDNFSVWVASATYEPGITGNPDPLQDNGQRIQRFMLHSMLHLTRQSVVRIRALLSIQWCLIAGVGITFGALELQLVPGRTLWGVCIRTCCALACLRAIRVVSFLITVLPSQNPHCYRQRFPVPPPEDWISWIQVGLRPAAHGGCNDLIISGHATVVTTFACVVTSVAGNVMLSVCLWSLLAIDFLIEVYEGFHYSVDMWLGVVLGTLIWRCLAPLETVDANTATSSNGSAVPTKLLSLTTMEILSYAAPTMAAYSIVIVLQSHYQVYGILVFLAHVVVYVVQQRGFTHYVQHSLFCLLVCALTIFI